jgi:hypothetical protein
MEQFSMGEKVHIYHRDAVKSPVLLDLPNTNLNLGRCCLYGKFHIAGASKTSYIAYRV